MKHNRDTHSIGYMGKMVSILLAVILWELVAKRLNQRVLLASPIEVCASLLCIIKQSSCWESVLFSIGHILAGFFLALVSGILLAILSNRIHLFEVFLWPYMAVVKATPVASFIILCLVWVDIKNLSIVISFLMVLPVVYHNYLSGMHSIDNKLLEMAKVNRMPYFYRFLAIDLMGLKEAVLTTVSTGVAMAFKSGIAAEVIGVPAGSIGKMLYQAKIYLCTADMLAWTVLIVVCSVVVEKALMLLVKAGYGSMERIVKVI